MLKLKFIFSVLLICCLFLPLSQCTSQSKKIEGQHIKDVVTPVYVFNSATDVYSWLRSASFIAPFVLLILGFRNFPKVKFNIVFLVLGLAALYSVFSATFWSQKILVGGYIAYVSASTLVVLACVELIQSVLKVRKKA
jgi:hypothetical protein